MDIFTFLQCKFGFEVIAGSLEALLSGNLEVWVVKNLVDLGFCGVQFVLLTRLGEKPSLSQTTGYWVILFETLHFENVEVEVCQGDGSAACICEAVSELLVAAAVRYCCISVIEEAIFLFSH